MKQGADGTPVAEICRKSGISQATCFAWKTQDDGLLPTEMQRLKQLEDENAKLKKLVADLSLEKKKCFRMLSADPKGGEANALRPARDLKSTADSRYGWMRKGGHVSTNRRISDKAPAVYLADIVAKQGTALFPLQAIPYQPDLLDVGVYREFLAERRRLLANRLNAFLQVDEPHNLT